jgi:hypothetical protein
LNRHRIRCRVRVTSSGATGSNEETFREQRNLLQTRFRGWEQLLPIYMPGLLQYQTDLASGSITARYSPHDSDNPEDVDIWLPSRIAEAHRSRVCREGLADIEERIRTAQCYDALDAIRHALTVKSRMIMFKNKNVRGQKDGLRSRSVIDRVHEKAREQAAKYRTAREAKYALCGEGPWKDVLRVLLDGDVRGYRDKNILRVRKGRPGTLEDEQVEVAGDSGIKNAEMEDGSGIPLLEEERDRRDGTGETRRTLSWIWTTESRTPNEGDETDDVLRSEWAKSRARANRCKEEVLLLKEEMRRVLVFLEWKSDWWLQQQSLREGLPLELGEGLRAFSFGQADLQKHLASHFKEIWCHALDSDNNDDNDDDDDDDGSEYEGDLEFGEDDEVDD